MKRLFALLFTFGLFLPAAPSSVPAARRYAVILQEPPVARQVASRHELRSARALAVSARIEQAQQELRRNLAGRNVRVAGSVKTLLNAVFVTGSEQDVAALRSLPGVRSIVPLRTFKLHLNKALSLVKTPEAWDALVKAGLPNPGAGVKIAVIDTGIDQNHPAFQDPSLEPPAGFPKCAGADCAYTNNKVIVARSYVWMAAQGDPTVSSPDDLSPRDRVGHGTAAAMIAAGVENQGPLAKITGVAPKAFLGNYKVFGSPGVNDGTPEDTVVQALEDALNDGMDVATMSLGFPAWFSPTDTGAVCGAAAGDPCEVGAQAVENAVAQGMVVAVSAGNDGDYGLYTPALSTIHTPGIAPSALTVGSTRNAHEWFSSVSAAGAGAPDNVKGLAASSGDGPALSEAFTAPLKDVNADGCAAIGTPLTGAVALIPRGGCYFLDKVLNAQAAGASAVIFYDPGNEKPFGPSGLSSTTIPSMLVGKTSGQNLKAYALQQDARVTLDPSLKEFVDNTANALASFSSRGPSIAPETALKPEVVAPGTNIYMAAQRYDPNGQLYSPDGYVIANGTSFSAPMAAGVAALVKQVNREYTPAQIKSAIVNTAAGGVQDGGGAAGVTAVGAGLLNAAGAVRSNVWVAPATVTFGVLTPALMGSSRKLHIINGSGAALSLQPARPDAHIELSATSVAPHQTTDVTVSLRGAMPPAGSYEGVITITGGAEPLRVPYLYIVGDNVPDNVIPVTNQDFDGTVNEQDHFSGLRVIDRYGAPVLGAPVTWNAYGGATVTSADAQTYAYGWAGAFVKLGGAPDTYQDITATIGGSSGLQYTFTAFPRAVPTIDAGGVVNGASWQEKNGSLPAISPGSYLSIFGHALADYEAKFDWYLPKDYVYLPVSLAGVSVSFDSGDVSVPGHLSYVSPGQINVQVPWELQGRSSASMKVTVGDSRSAVYTVKLADAAPGIFEFDPYQTGQVWAAAQHANTQPYTDIGPPKPAKSGEWIVVWATGLGPVKKQPASGDVAPSGRENLAPTVLPVSVTIGGKAVTEFDFAGLSPNYIGLYQINLKVPEGVPPGVQNMIVTVGGSSSKPARIAIE
ncbi:MAG: S8 family serine peptidase [Acidobacteriota bacterium]